MKKNLLDRDCVSEVFTDYVATQKTTPSREIHFHKETEKALVLVAKVATFKLSTILSFTLVPCC